MSFKPEHRNDIALPSWAGKIFAIFLFIVGLGMTWYGVHDGIIDRNIAFVGGAEKVIIAKGLFAVVMGLVFSGIGIALTAAAVLIFKRETKI